VTQASTRTGSGDVKIVNLAAPNVQAAFLAALTAKLVLLGLLMLPNSALHVQLQLSEQTKANACLASTLHLIAMAVKVLRLPVHLAPRRICLILKKNVFARSEILTQVMTASLL